MQISPESLCLRGEWIEIRSKSLQTSSAASLSACAESGLKSVWDGGGTVMVSGLSACAESGLKSATYSLMPIGPSLSACAESGLK